MRGAHLYADTVAGSPLELAGDRARYAGGNAALDVLMGGGPSAPVSPAAQLGSSVPGGVNGGSSSNGAGFAVANTSGGTTTLPRVQFAIGGLFLLAIAALVLLNKAGFKFSVTVG